MMEAQRSVEMPQALALAIFSRQFSALVDIGTTLVGSLTAMGTDSPAPYDAAARELCDEVQKGETLSRSMARHPELFSPFYARLIRVGEIGGILEVSLACLADMAEEGWIATQHSGPDEAVDWLLAPRSEAAPREWSELTDSQRVFTLMSFTWALGVMLGSGVPADVALKTAADLLPSALRQAVQAVAAGDLSKGMAGPLGALGFLPALALKAIESGEHWGSLDRALERVATAYRHEFRCRVAQSRDV